jgi:Asp-tRNA(Asn)/Glu-tRNA(Gln) amidotransferase A subunit family amidase
MARPSRRHFVARALLAGLAGACAEAPRPPAPRAPRPAPPPAPSGPPPTAPDDVTAATIAEAEKLVAVRYVAAERERAARSWRANMGPCFALRERPPLDPALAPASVWNPRAAAGAPPPPPRPPRPVAPWRPAAAPPLPADERDLAYAPVAHLAAWLRQRKVTSRALAELSLRRLEAFGPRLACVVTLTRDLALEQADRADRELERGRARGPLHGVPYGVKDLLDTAGIATTWGAEPLRDRVPREDAVVVKRLREAGAVLVAKLSLGALALNDVWFGGQTKNPWLPEEGSSGSSAGSGAAVAAGCVPFAVGSETLGSIVSPSSRCGVVGLRPTFGRVARTGAMTLCWSLDKLGPMARSVEDAALALAAMSGPDPGDPSSAPGTFEFDPAAPPVKNLRVGFVPAWLERATEPERAALEAARRAGLSPTEVAFPDLPYGALLPALFAEAAASFDELVRSRGIDRLGTPQDDAWPNVLRQARLLSAVDLVQADRLRRRVARELDELMRRVDVLLVPALRDEALTATNFSGHPSLTLRAGFVTIDRLRSDFAPPPGRELPALRPPRRVPQGVTLIGRLFDEATLCRAGLVLERELGVAGERPPGFLTRSSVRLRPLYARPELARRARTAGRPFFGRAQPSRQTLSRGRRFARVPSGRGGPKRRPCRRAGPNGRRARGRCLSGGEGTKIFAPMS